MHLRSSRTIRSRCSTTGTYFPAIVAALDRAVYEIFLESYIYRDDAIGRRTAEVLERAASRDVVVHVLLDGHGSNDLPRRVLDQLQAHRVKTLVYGPKISRWTFRRERLRRMHRKIVFVDREISFVGGINIADDREGGVETAPRHDYAVAVEGPLVDLIRRSARRLWSSSSWLPFRTGIAVQRDVTAASGGHCSGGSSRKTLRVPSSHCLVRVSK